MVEGYFWKLDRMDPVTGGWRTGLMASKSSWLLVYTRRCLRQEWRIPLSKMKGRKRDKESNPTAFHLVPSVTQTISILREVQALTGGGTLVFPGLRNSSKPIIDATMANALRRMGYSQKELHVHGFRAMARTLIRQELGFDEELFQKYP